MVVRMPPRRTVSSEARRGTAPHRRRTSSRTAPPTCETAPSPTTTKAASLSRASPTSRRAICRVSGGAPSSTTSVKAPLRSRMSAHQAPRAGSCGRTTRRKSQSSDAQSAGSSVREASMQATPWPRASAAPMKPRMSVAFPAPSGPVNSVSRPRGKPPPRATSSAARPVGRASAATGGGATICSICVRSWAICIRANTCNTSGYDELSITEQKPKLG